MNWTHAECLKAGKIYKKHGINCRTYKTNENGYNAGDSYLILYVNKVSGAKREGNSIIYEEEFDQEFAEGVKLAKKECMEKGIIFQQKTKLRQYENKKKKTKSSKNNTSNN